MKPQETFVAAAVGEKGYLEKSRKNWDLYGVNCLYPKEKFAGADNVTKYAYDTLHYKKYGWAAWCMSFVCWVAMSVFGPDKANELLCGKYSSASTMEVKDAMVKAGREVDIGKAQPGDIVFRSRNGGGHVGIVKGWQDGKIVTIEGNSSASDITSWNGGAVVEHIGASWQWCCRPDWSLVQPIGWHWVKSGGKWYYQDENGVNAHGWQKIKETNGDFYHWYFFDSKGAMLTGVQTVDEKLCLFMPDGGLEGALCISDQWGYQAPWYL